jgi:hypothetical protein
MLGRSFYVFTGMHSLLIGLFPFYIPVYLYSIGLTLSRICLFVAATGAGFCLSLFLWDRVCRRVPFYLLIVCSFFSEFLLLSMFFLEKDLLFVLAACVVNGFFNCNFWIIQRLLFVGSTGPQNSGRNYGNSQIFVLVVLKAGILIGGFLMENSGLITLYLISAGIVLLGAVIFSCCVMDGDINGVIKQAKPISILSIARFKDSCRSRSVFGIDGVFLYLESYYWLISLFIIVRESFLKLALVVILLAILFGIVFQFIKSNIDRLPEQRMYFVENPAACRHIEIHHDVSQKHEVHRRHLRPVTDQIHMSKCHGLSNIVANLPLLTDLAKIAVPVVIGQTTFDLQLAVGACPPSLQHRI